MVAAAAQDVYEISIGTEGFGGLLGVAAIFFQEPGTLVEVGGTPRIGS